MVDNTRTLRKRINDLDDALAKADESFGRVRECARLVDIEETYTLDSASEIIAALETERDTAIKAIGDEARKRGQVEQQCATLRAVVVSVRDYLIEYDTRDPALRDEILDRIGFDDLGYPRAILARADTEGEERSIRANSRAVIHSAQPGALMESAMEDDDDEPHGG